MDLIRTQQTYKTRENAIKALSSKIDLNEYRWLIACNEEGRYVPCVLGAENIPLAHEGITVLG